MWYLKDEVDSELDESKYHTDDHDDTLIDPPNREDVIKTPTRVKTRSQTKNAFTPGDWRANLALVCSEDFALKCDSNESADDPSTFNEAMQSKDKAKWKDAMNDEINSLKENKTWDLVRLPAGKRVVKNKWVFKLKKGSDGKIVKYKARMVAKGFTQRYGIDYEETYSPVVRYTSVRVLMGIAVQRQMKIYQMDAVTAFL